jgi:flagellar L-ring protein precursor FlgH
MFGQRKAVWLVVGLSAGLQACIIGPMRDPDYAATRPASPTAAAQPSGGIFQAVQGVALFEDLRARRVGDMITVRLVEATNASKSASTTTKKNGKLGLSNPTVLGTSVEFDVARGFPLQQTTNLNLGTSVDNNSQFKGDAGSTQKNSLSGNITVTVTEVLPNGNLVVRGEKVLAINQGHEYVKLAGIVRPQDILPDNSVLSTQVADAHILYGGEGTLAEANTMGWFTRFFQSPWWPF